MRLSIIAVLAGCLLILVGCCRPWFSSADDTPTSPPKMYGQYEPPLPREPIVRLPIRRGNHRANTRRHKRMVITPLHRPCRSRGQIKAINSKNRRRSGHGRAFEPFSIAIRDGAIGGGRVGLLRLGVPNAHRRQPRDCTSAANKSLATTIKLDELLAAFIAVVRRFGVGGLLIGIPSYPTSRFLN